jgi:thioredoxin 1
MREVSDATFEAEVVAAPQPVLVDFWAPWCAPCERIEPTLAALPLEVVRLDVDENPLTASRYGVLTLPTVILFESGEPRASVVGARGRGHFQRAFATWL